MLGRHFCWEDKLAILDGQVSRTGLFGLKGEFWVQTAIELCVERAPNLVATLYPWLSQHFLAHATSFPGDQKQTIVTLQGGKILSSLYQFLNLLAKLIYRVPETIREKH